MISPKIRMYYKPWCEMIFTGITKNAGNIFIASKLFIRKYPVFFQISWLKHPKFAVISLSNLC